MVCERGRRREHEAKGEDGGTYLDCKGRVSQGNMQIGGGGGRPSRRVAAGYRYKLGGAWVAPRWVPVTWKLL